MAGLGTVNIAGKTYEIPEETEFTFGDARLIRDLTGYTWAEWFNAMTEGDMVALGGLAYVLMRREDPSVSVEDVDRLRIVDFDVSGDDEASAEGNEPELEVENAPATNGASATTREDSGAPV